MAINAATYQLQSTAYKVPETFRLLRTSPALMLPATAPSSWHLPLKILRSWEGARELLRCNETTRVLVPPQTRNRRLAFWVVCATPRTNGKPRCGQVLLLVVPANASATRCWRCASAARVCRKKHRLPRILARSGTVGRTNLAVRCIPQNGAWRVL